MECTSYNKKLVPLRRVVAASVIDKYEDLGRSQEYYTHWAARGLRKLQNEVLKKGMRYAMLTINKNTNTATLPPDFDYETFIGTIYNGIKVPMRLRGDIAPHKSYIETISGVDKCTSCEQPKSICNDLHITEEVNIVTIEGQDYEEKVIKKLYPNGDYYIETLTPVKDFETNAITTTTTKEFVTNFDLKECGCLETTTDNLEKLESACPEIYGCYYAPCDCECVPQSGSYRIFEELNIIQFYGINVDKVYIEYVSFITKISGQYYVPEVAFETLVNFVKFKSVENKKGVALSERNWFLDQYKRERRNMEKILGRVSLSSIINSVGLTPKFNFSSGNDWYWRFCGNAVVTNTNGTQEIVACEEESIQVAPSGDTIIKAGEVLEFKKKKFSIGAIGALMEENDTQLVINDKNVKPDSLHVVLDGTKIWEYDTDDDSSDDDVVGYRVIYNLNNVVINFNSPVTAEQKYTISYAKVI